MSGNLFMNLCNICNVRTEGFSTGGAGPTLIFSSPPLSFTMSGYTYYVIGSNTTITVTNALTNVTYFAVGGGGGGGFNYGAGGGAGGLQTNDPNLSGVVTLSQYNAGYLKFTPTAYSVVIGDGGAGDTNIFPVTGLKGSNAIFWGSGITTISAVGGGGGGSYDYAWALGQTLELAAVVEGEVRLRLDPQLVSQTQNLAEQDRKDTRVVQELQPFMSRVAAVVSRVLVLMQAVPQEMADLPCFT